MPDVIRHPEAIEKTIGVGKPGYPGSPPSEPDVRISRIRLSGRRFTSRGLEQGTMGIVKAKIPKVPKVLVWPASVVPAPADALFLVIATQDASEPAPDPPIKRLEGCTMAVFEVFKPSFVGSANVCNNLSHASAVAPSGLTTDGVFELLQAFLTRPAGAVFKPIPKKFEAFIGLMGIDHAGLVRVQGQPSLFDQLGHLRQCRFGLLPTFAQDNKVSRPRELPAQPLSEPGVNLSAHRAPIIQPPV